MSVRILVVDDHTNTRVALGIGLRRLGHVAMLAKSADEALMAMGATAFDCVVCDVRMRPVDGLALGRIIRQRSPSLPIVFMTAYDLSASERAVAAEFGAPCLTKPVELDAMLEAVIQVTRA